MTILLMAAAASLNLMAIPEATNPASWVTDDDYPPEALSAGENGVVTFEIDVNPNGKGVRCAVRIGTGFPKLDTAVCPLVLPRTSFKAARDEHGKSAWGVFVGRYNWQIYGRQRSPEPMSPADVTLTLAKLPNWYSQRLGFIVQVNTDGRIVSCARGNSERMKILSQASVDSLCRGVMTASDWPIRMSDGSPVSYVRAIGVELVTN